MRSTAYQWAVRGFVLLSAVIFFVPSISPAILWSACADEADKAFQVARSCACARVAWGRSRASWQGRRVY